VKSRGGILTRLGTAAAFACIGLLVAAPTAAADTSKPLVSTTAWYWEQAEAHDVEGPQGTASVDTNNEYCPQIPGGGLGNVSEETCADGRLPLRIAQGDYETPNQVPVVMFDTLTSVPFGAEVEKFTATFEEAKAGCREKETAPSGQQCETSDPVNVEGHEIQACLVQDLFGEGYARPYREIPRYECTDQDPTAERKKDGNTFTWTFDLTEYAQKWADGAVPVSAVLLNGVEPKDTGPNDSWRVTLLGNPDGGIKAAAVFDPPKVDPLVPPAGPGDTVIPGTPGTAGIPGTPGTPGTAGTPPTETAAPGSGASGGSGTGGPAEPGEAKAPVEAPAEEPPSEAAGANAGPASGGLPWYAWLAMLAGLAAFSVLRTVVLDGAAGFRQDGVLAHIQKLNAARRGGAPAARVAQPGLWSAFVGMTAGITSTAGSLGRKVSNSKVISKAAGAVRKIKPGKRS
jgi:hypothetical protein